jgi:hypothetical protein
MRLKATCISTSHGDFEPGAEGEPALGASENHYA